jgi:hypothetical protein
VFFGSEVRLSSCLKKFFENLVKLAKEVSLVVELENCSKEMKP